MHNDIYKRPGKHGTKLTTVVDIPPDPVTGRRRQKRITADTKREVERQVVALRHSMNTGQYVDASKETVREYLVRWLDSIDQSVRPSTKRRYGDLIRLHIIPFVGQRRLDNLSPLDVQALYSNRLAYGLSPSTVAMIHNVLHGALKQAVRWGMLVRNVTEMVNAPKESPSDHKVWSEREAAQFLAVADLDRYAALWRLAVLTGMRKGEILGLRWDDVDLERGVVAVRRSYSRGGDSASEYGQPKTKHGRRAISLPGSVVDSLRAHRIRQAETRLMVGPAYMDEDVVFATDNGRPLHPNSLAHRYKRLIKESGLPPIRFHDLRHTSATLMLANGEHPKIAQERLGHSDISITLNLYSHVTMDMQRDAAERLDSLITGA